MPQILVMQNTKKMLMNGVESILDILGYDVKKDLLSKPQLVNSSF
jgi:hypothetical protein